jgi:hypothetical protein
MKANKTKTDRRIGMKTLTTFFALGYSLFVFVSPAGANPVWINNTWSTGQDGIGVWGSVDELGNKPAFPNNEWIDSNWTTTTYRPCSQNPDSPSIPNIAVSITNRTNNWYPKLYYVADPETTLQNYDQNRLNGMLAFKIDKIGSNTPLIYESMGQNLWFEPGETWTFVIQDYVNTLGLPASAFGSLGVPSAGDYLSSGSIITPEPATLSLLGLGGLSLFRRRRCS